MSWTQAGSTLAFMSVICFAVGVGVIRFGYGADRESAGVSLLVAGLVLGILTLLTLILW